MTVSYLLTHPRPPLPDLDAPVQQARLLQTRHGGELTFIYPARRFHRWLPASLCGLGHRRRLRRLEKRVTLHHLFSARLLRYPLLESLRRPLVYSLIGSPGRDTLHRACRLVRPACFVVSDETLARRLEAAQPRPVRVVRPGIDLSRFDPSDPPRGRGFVLLAGSAPWTRRQFATKGYDLLLEAVRRVEGLRLVLLWRGVLRRELRRRIDRAGLGGRVEVIDERVDVGEVLARVHAAVVLARAPHLVKAYPHSLLESLAAGRPVLLSGTLAMSRWVEASECGASVSGWGIEPLCAAIEKLRGRYRELLAATAALDLAPFSLERFLEDHEAVYRLATAGHAG